MDNKPILLNKYPVTCHTDHIGLGSTFVAIKGMKEDGIKYIKKAIELGAAKVIVADDAKLDVSLLEFINKQKVQLTYVSDTRVSLANLSAQAFDYPALDLRIIAITGTKGKSTTSFLTEHILKTAGYKTALLSTVKNRILDTDFPATLTTAQPDYLHMFLNICREKKVEYVIMEVAAQAVTLHRVLGIEFDIILFTNFSLEHSEFYCNIDDYFNSKVQLIKQLKDNGMLILNCDDNKVISCDNKHKNIRTFSLSKETDFFAIQDKLNLCGLQAVMINNIKQDKCLVKAPSLVGQFNLYNMLAAYSIASVIDVKCKDIQEAFKTFLSVPGRLQKIDLPNGSIAFIDYAHNPSSYEAVLGTIRPMTDNLIVVFGAGGDRDKNKRPLMGAIAAKYGDILMVTADNPRFEDLNGIINDILIGIHADNKHKIDIEPDRENAIKKAYSKSKKGSIIILLGKGPDEYQIVGDVKVPFSEIDILKAL